MSFEMMLDGRLVLSRDMHVNIEGKLLQVTEAQP